MKINYSKLSLYLTCPFRYKKIYIENNWPPKSPEILKGENIHRFLFDLGNFFLDKKDLSHFPKKPDYITSKEYNILIANTKTIFGDIISAPKVQFEEPIEKSINGIEFTGRADRILEFPDKIVITDYKTGRFFEFLGNIKENLQFQIYSILGSKIFNKPVLFEVIQIRDSVIKKVWNGFTDEDELIKTATIFLENLHQEKFDPKPNNFCKICHVKEECPLFHPQIKIENKEDKFMNEKDYVSTSFSYSVRTQKGSILSLKAELGRSLKDGENYNNVFAECWKEVEKQVEEQIGSLDLNVL